MKNNFVVIYELIDGERYRNLSAIYHLTLPFVKRSMTLVIRRTAKSTRSKPTSRRKALSHLRLYLCVLLSTSITDVVLKQSVVGGIIQDYHPSNRGNKLAAGGRQVQEKRSVCGRY